MKHPIILALVAVLLMSAAGPCQIAPSEVTVDQALWYQTKIDAKEDAEARGDLAAAEAIEAELQDFEAPILARRADPVTKLVSGIYPPAAPLAPLLPAALTALFPLIGDRGREHFKKALRAATPGAVGPNGKRGPDWRGALAALAKYAGAFHSEDPKLAEFAKEAPAPEPAA